MSVNDSPQSRPSSIINLEDLYETTAEELQRLLGNHDNHRWSLEDEILIDDCLVQLCAWGADLDIESGALQNLCEKEVVVVRSNLDLVRSSIAEVDSEISRESGAASTVNALDRLGLNVKNLCELSNSLQIAINLNQHKGPAFKVKEYMDSLSRKLAPPGPSNLEDAEREGPEARPPLDTGTQDPEKGYSSDLVSILQRCQRRSANGEPFWPDELLKRIMTRDRVLESLDSHTKAPIDTIVLPAETSPGLSGRGLVKIYALLTLLGKSEQIQVFIEEGLLDKDLPLRYEGANFFRGEEALRCFQGWRPSEKSLFDAQQWGFAVPFLWLAPTGSPKHYDLDSRTIIPWTYDSTDPVMEIAGASDGEVSEVHRIAIDPDSQGLWEPLREMGLDDTLFALRKLSLKYGDKETFGKERDQLRRLSDTRDKHLLTLLASISYDGHYNFLFPYAECDLLQFWKDWHPEPPPQDMEETRWLIRQLSGLVGAMDTVHTQRDCHGDICPQQIHCLRSSHDPRGVTVLSSYGIPFPNPAKGHSDSVFPRYWRLRDSFGGDTLSRTYDIWSLGLVFMEFVTWFLGGGKLVRQFESQWISQPPGGSTTPSTIEDYMTEGHAYAANILEPIESSSRDWAPIENRIWPLENSDDTYMGWTRRANRSLRHMNPEAIEWIEELNHHQNCTRFIKDILSIIQRRMLSVVLADTDTRYSSDLQDEFGRLYRQCGGDISAYPSPRGPVSNRREAPLASTESKRPSQAALHTPGQHGTGTLDFMVDTASDSRRNS
ncbi:hypothetical protein NCS57_01179600 [Fusarium keratoplasticum]|uniref:Uncharacterized protein n=1 Tax=Fusarium keratoplasticum TaxID=1328300 RepID=A0ACC0QMM0_9HYPO|nr:hypothetical protein NCS57_01179600 [Fusarium keratoplasticum]KAI8657993.1 hypothetical protein NCS57_01179600 [Fusarium keratoplasticum]